MGNSSLRKNQRCPIHQSLFCCGRSQRSSAAGGRKTKLHVQRIEDASHPRRYREICSDQEKRRRKEQLMRSDPTCALCFEKFTDFRDVVLEHKDPKGASGAFRDDHRDNLQLAHRICNLEKGSRRLNPKRQSMDELRDEFHADRCPHCKLPKRDGHAFCVVCFRELPPQLQHDLYRLSGRFSGSYSYPDAVADAKDFLNSQTALKAIRLQTAAPATPEEGSNLEAFGSIASEPRRDAEDDMA